MADPTRMDRLINMLGGEDNLPPKMPTIAVTSDSSTQANHEENTSNNNTTATHKGPYAKYADSAQWNEPAPEASDMETSWHAEPDLPQPPHTSSGPAALPYSYNGASHYAPDPRKDEPAPLGICFSPFAAITKFCYKFVRKDLVQPLATAFFDSNKIWSREWDLYYIWSDHFPTSKPILFVPEHQLDTLIEEINLHFPNAKVKISDDLREDGLVIDFDDIELAELRPRFLGHSTSREQIDYWTDHLPLPPHVIGHPMDRSHEAFRAKMELANEISKNKTKAGKKKRQAEHVLKRQDMVRMMTRAQRYLGMVSAAPTTPSSLESAMSSVSLSPAPIDITNFMPYPFDSDVIFIAIDLEAYERAPRPITEVGIATLDTRDLRTMAPGPTGTEWQPAIRARHIRIAEHMNLVNHDFVAGCPDKFEFGQSEFVGLDKLTQRIASCFKPPYSGPAEEEGEEEEEEEKKEKEKRNIVLVGHDIGADINYLRQLGYDVANCSNIVDTVDTAQMFRAYTKDPNPRSLGNTLLEFDLTGWNLHNAGNDAVYTLWAMLAMCVQDGSERGSAEAVKQREEKRAQRTEVLVEQARERAEEEMEGWERTGDLGGAAVPPARAEPKPMFGPRRKEDRQYYTVGGAILDV